MTQYDQYTDTYKEPTILTDEDRAFLSAIQDPVKRQQVIKILLGE